MGFHVCIQKLYKTIARNFFIFFVICFNMSDAHTYSANGQIYGFSMLGQDASFFGCTQPEVDKDLLVITQSLESELISNSFYFPLLEPFNPQSCSEYALSLCNSFEQYHEEAIALICDFDLQMKRMFLEFIEEKKSAFKILSASKTRGLIALPKKYQLTDSALLQESALYFPIFARYDWAGFAQEIYCGFFNDIMFAQDAYYDQVTALVNEMRKEYFWMMFLHLGADQAKPENRVVMINGCSNYASIDSVYDALMRSVDCKIVSFKNQFGTDYAVLYDDLQAHLDLIAYLEREISMQKFCIEKFGYSSNDYMAHYGFCYKADYTKEDGIYTLDGRFVTAVHMPQDSANYYFNTAVEYPGGINALTAQHLAGWKWYQRQILETVKRVDIWSNDL